MLLAPFFDVESRRRQRKAIAVVGGRAVLKDALVRLGMIVIIAKAPQHRVVAVGAVAHHAVRDADTAQRTAEKVALQRHHALPHGLRAARVDKKLHHNA